MEVAWLCKEDQMKQICLLVLVAHGCSCRAPWVRADNPWLQDGDGSGLAKAPARSRSPRREPSK